MKGLILIILLGINTHMNGHLMRTTTIFSCIKDDENLKISSVFIEISS